MAFPQDPKFSPQGRTTPDPNFWWNQPSWQGGSFGGGQQVQQSSYETVGNPPSPTMLPEQGAPVGYQFGGEVEDQADQIGIIDAPSGPPAVDPGSGLPPPASAPQTGYNPSAAMAAPGASAPVAMPPEEQAPPSQQPKTPRSPKQSKPKGGGDRRGGGRKSGRRRRRTGYAYGGEVEDDYSYSNSGGSNDDYSYSNGGGSNDGYVDYSRPEPERERNQEYYGTDIPVDQNQGYEDQSIPENARATEGQLDDQSFAQKSEPTGYGPDSSYDSTGLLKEVLNYSRNLFGLGDKSGYQPTSRRDELQDQPAREPTIQPPIPPRDEELLASAQPSARPDYPPPPMPAGGGLGRGAPTATPAAAYAEPPPAPASSVPISEAPPGSVPGLGLGEQAGAIKPDLHGYMTGANADPADRLAAKLQAIAANTPGASEAEITQRAVTDPNISIEDRASTLAGMRQSYDHTVAMAQAALDSGNAAAAARLGTTAHDRVPDGQTLDIKPTPDGNFIATVGSARGGDTQSFPMTQQQFRDYLVGPATSFDHVVENGVTKNLQIATGQVGGAGRVDTQGRPIGPTPGAPVPAAAAESAQRYDTQGRPIGGVSGISGGPQPIESPAVRPVTAAPQPIESPAVRPVTAAPVPRPQVPPVIRPEHAQRDRPYGITKPSSTAQARSDVAASRADAREQARAAPQQTPTARVNPTPGGGYRDVPYQPPGTIPDPGWTLPNGAPSPYPNTFMMHGRNQPVPRDPTDTKYEMIPGGNGAVRVPRGNTVDMNYYHLMPSEDPSHSQIAVPKSAGAPGMRDVVKYDIGGNPVELKMPSYWDPSKVRYENPYGKQAGRELYDNPPPGMEPVAPTGQGRVVGETANLRASPEGTEGNLGRRWEAPLGRNTTGAPPPASDRSPEAEAFRMYPNAGDAAKRSEFLSKRALEQQKTEGTVQVEGMRQTRADQDRAQREAHFIQQARAAAARDLSAQQRTFMTDYHTRQNNNPDSITPEDTRTYQGIQNRLRQSLEAAGVPIPPAAAEQPGFLRSLLNNVFGGGQQPQQPQQSQPQQSQPQQQPQRAQQLNYGAPGWPPRPPDPGKRWGTDAQGNFVQY